MSTTELTTLGLALDRFLQEEIAIPTTARSKASASQNYLRAVLRKKASTDVEFPELLAEADTDFLGGSFARHTKIWPLDDIDLFIPLNGGRFNLHAKWISSSFSSSGRHSNYSVKLVKVESRRKCQFR